MKYKLRHKLTEEAIADLLSLIKLHCPSPNRSLTSVYLLKKQFLDINYPIVIHRLCSTCLHTIDTSESEICPNSICKKTLNKIRFNFIIS